MYRRQFALFGLAALAGGCSRIGGSLGGSAGSIGSAGSGWFAPREEELTLEPEEGYASRVVDRRGLIDQVTEIRLDRTPGGVILRAKGLPEAQGFWDGELVRVPNPPAGERAYVFRVADPFERTNIGTDRSREVVVATFISEQDLAGVRAITVTAARNVRALRR